MYYGPKTTEKCYNNIDLNATGANVSTKKCYVGTMFIYNENASAKAYIKLYNKATIADSLDTPREVFPLGPLQGATIILDEYFDTGLSVRATTGKADNNNVAPTANDVSIVIRYNDVLG